MLKLRIAFMLLMILMPCIWSPNNLSAQTIVVEPMTMHPGWYKFSVNWGDDCNTCLNASGESTSNCHPNPGDILVGDSKNVPPYYDPCNNTPGASCGSRCAAYKYFWDFGDGFYWGNDLNSRNAGPSLPEDDWENTGQVVYHQYNLSSQNYYAGSGTDINNYKASCMVFSTYSKDPPPEDPKLLLIGDDDLNPVIIGDVSGEYKNLTAEDLSISQIKTFTSMSALASGDVADLVVVYKKKNVDQVDIKISLGKFLSFADEQPFLADNTFAELRPNSTRNSDDELEGTLVIKESEIGGSQVSTRLRIKVDGGISQDLEEVIKTQIRAKIHSLDLIPINNSIPQDTTNRSTALTLDISKIRDPNIISVKPEELFTCSNNSEFLIYTIQFQNMGRSSAQEIKVEFNGDDNLDYSSFQLVESFIPINSSQIEVMPEENKIVFTYEKRCRDDDESTFKDLLKGYHELIPPDIASEDPPSFGTARWDGFLIFKLKYKRSALDGIAIEATAKTKFSRFEAGCNPMAGVLEADSAESPRPARTEIVQNTVKSPWIPELRAGLQSPIIDKGTPGFGGWMVGIQIKKGIATNGTNKCETLRAFYYKPEIMYSRLGFAGATGETFFRNFIDVTPLQFCRGVPLGDRLMLDPSIGYMASIPLIQGKPFSFPDLDHSLFLDARLVPSSSKFSFGVRGLVRRTQVFDSNPYFYGQLYAQFAFD
ncbi:MAG: hypothetical protein MRZ79_08875 [Bacteroidia bacterium]|nr:hypothetical protein [Bacteroidia bacterium]